MEKCTCEKGSELNNKMKIPHISVLTLLLVIIVIMMWTSHTEVIFYGVESKWNEAKVFVTSVRKTSNVNMPYKMSLFHTNLNVNLQQKAIFTGKLLQGHKKSLFASVALFIATTSRGEKLKRENRIYRLFVHPIPPSEKNLLFDFDIILWDFADL